MLSREVSGAWEEERQGATESSCWGPRAGRPFLPCELGKDVPGSVGTGCGLVPLSPRFLPASFLAFPDPSHLEKVI